VPAGAVVVVLVVAVPPPVADDCELVLDEAELV
jgi:hypothetical protein